MAITSRDDYYNALGGPKTFVNIYKSSLANLAAAYIASLWRATGSPLWLQGAIPSVAETPTDATVGGINLPAFNGATGYVLRFAPVGATIGTWMLYDRLAHMGGLSGTNAGVQTVNVTLTTAAAAGRCLSSGNNVEWYVEIYTDIGTTAANLTVTYTDSADTGSKTVVLSGFSGASPLNRLGRCVPIVPTDNLAIKSIQSVQLSTSTLTAGNFGITARRRLASAGQLLANILPPGVDGLSLGLPVVQETSCLELLVLCSTTSTGICYGEVLIGYK